MIPNVAQSLHEERLSFLEDIVYIWGTYKTNDKTSDKEYYFLSTLQSDELIKKLDDTSYTATKKGVDMVMKRRDNFLRGRFGTMDNYPIFSANLHAGEITQLETQSEKFSNVCDEVRWLMFDWMEYQEKQGIVISHNVFLDMWSVPLTGCMLNGKMRSDKRRHSGNAAHG